MIETQSFDAVSSGASHRQSLFARCGRLLAAVLGLWLLLAGPAYLIAGVPALEGLAYSAGLCLIPGWLVFAIASKARDANQQATLTILGGMGFRMLFVLVGLVAIQSFRPHLGMREFVVWLLVFYMATVALETWMVVSGLKQSKAEPDDSVQ